MSEEKKVTEKVTSPSDDDKELSELLDSALEDFGDSSKKRTTEKSKESEKEDDKKTEESGEVLPSEEWSEDFIRQAVEKFESSISNILKDGGMPDLSTDELQKSFQQMAEAATQVGANTNVEETGDVDFANSISQALRGLSEGTEGLPGAFNEENLMSMFGGQTQGQENSFLPFMQGMMQSLLSKEVLYPSLKDISSKYPGWLETHGGTITPEERVKYEEQYSLMKEICTQFENQKANDTPDQKKKQYETVLDLMQKMQDFGQPPAELVGDLGGQFPLDGQGNPDLNQCSLM